MEYLNKFLLSLFIIGLIFIGNNSKAYYFGLKSSDDTVANITNIEYNLNIQLPIVSFIFSPREDKDVLNTIDQIVDKLGTNRVYHITISPNNYSAEEVAMGKFDEQYKAFFKKIKEKNLHVIFRTMHEMNGGRYPRASNPERFKAARIHVRSLSRLAGLDETNIAFDFSINHRDMPTKSTPTQSASLIQCTVNRTDCYHFEDYYPGDEFVDVIGFTFYNRGKATSNRKWLSPYEILYDSQQKTFERVQAFNKPIIIDEVATTSVRYNGNYNYDKSIEEYINNYDRKNYRLQQLQEFLVAHSEIIATVYFNCDFTQGLVYNVVGEADRAIVNFDLNKIYSGFRYLEESGEKDLTNILRTLFHVQSVTIDNNNVYVSTNYSRETGILSRIIEKKSSDNKARLDLVHQLQTIDFGSEKIDKALKILEAAYSK